MIYQKFISDFSEQNLWNTINCIFASMTHTKTNTKTKTQTNTKCFNMFYLLREVGSRISNMTWTGVQGHCGQGHGGHGHGGPGEYLSGEYYSG